MVLLSLFGFETLLKSVVETVQADPTILDKVIAIGTQLSVLITIVGGIVTYIVTNWRKVRKEELSERDKRMLEMAKQVQMGFQKGVETIGQNREVLNAIYETNISEEDRKKIEEKIGPILAETNSRLQKANEQAALIKAQAIQWFGPAADVDQDPTIPRESAGISAKLRKV